MARKGRKVKTAKKSQSLGNWVIAIEDNGIGQEHIARIFEMFYKAHDRAHGTGLGLYIVKETLQRLNGDIKVECEYGIGTTFTVTLAVGADQPQDSRQAADHFSALCCVSGLSYGNV